MRRLLTAALLAAALHGLLLIPRWGRFVQRESQEPVSRGAVALSLCARPRPAAPAFPAGPPPPRESRPFATVPPEPAPRVSPAVPQPKLREELDTPEPPPPEPEKAMPPHPEPAKPAVFSPLREEAQEGKARPAEADMEVAEGAGFFGPNPVPETQASGSSVSEPSSPSPLQEAVPLYRENPRPAYPRLARKRGYEGTVLLDVLVTRQGRAGEVEVAQSCGHRILDEAAQEAVRSWRFEPGKKGDEAVDMRVRIPVRFHLR